MTSGQEALCIIALSLVLILALHGWRHDDE